MQPHKISKERILIPILWKNGQKIVQTYNTFSNELASSSVSNYSEQIANANNRILETLLLLKTTDEYERRISMSDFPCCRV